MDQIIFALAELFSYLPDSAHIVIMGGHLELFGDGAFVSSPELSDLAWGEGDR